MIDDFKIRIHSPEESVIVQQLMCKLEYKWNGGEPELSHADKPFLYFEGKNILYSDFESTFVEESTRELTLEQLLDEIEEEIEKKGDETFGF